MRSPLILLYLLLLLPLGCSKEIGDECSSSVECGQARLCDRASEGGYCTVTPCEPGNCPEDSLCVEFENELTYCMALCEGSDDCREGYFCDQENAVSGFCRQEP